MLRLVRYVDAPPETVLESWLDGERLGRWLFRTPGGIIKTVEVDSRDGGEFTIIETRGSIDAAHYGSFRVIEPPKRIAFGFSVTRDQAPSEVTATFASQGEGTLVTLTHAVEPQWAEYAGMILQGWSRMLASLSAQLALVGTRALGVDAIIAAPSSKVWRAWTEPGALTGWWGGVAVTRPTVERMDVRPGGGFRLRIAPGAGPVLTVTGTYREVETGKRLVYDDVCEADGEPFYEELLEATFVSLGAKRTRLKVRAPLAPAMLKQPAAALDDLSIGWARGWADNLDALTAQLEAD